MEVTTEAVGARESCAVCIDNVKEAPRFHSWKPRPQQKKRKKKDEEGWGKVGVRGLVAGAERSGWVSAGAPK